jgi:hypothetical protein
MPYRKTSVNTAMHIVVRINVFEDLTLSRRGGGEVELSLAPERKSVNNPILARL